MNRTCMLPGQCNSHIRKLSQAHCMLLNFMLTEKRYVILYTILYETIVCFVQTVSNIVCLHEEGPTGPKHCIKL